MVCSDLLSYWGYGLGVEMVACVLVCSGVSALRG